MDMRWLMRAKRWAQNPPSAKQVRFVFIVIAICLAIALVAHVLGADSKPQSMRLPPIR
ncbi:hypothetical protein BVG79_01416 [Ketogulonicigenium robustum]|uniref:Uncharacterized protein n=1 Tax=Ketogulonicigenium robustum TaxID=92947 RepID=A0A1W6NZR9_9RHOB|nr:hypothetical protein BVG79_01416 [Ketogulonicigenium robustum]